MNFRLFALVVAAGSRSPPAVRTPDCRRRGEEGRDGSRRQGQGCCRKPGEGPPRPPRTPPRRPGCRQGHAATPPRMPPARPPTRPRTPPERRPTRPRTPPPPRLRCDQGCGRGSSPAGQPRPPAKPILPVPGTPGPRRHRRRGLPVLLRRLLLMPVNRFQAEDASTYVDSIRAPAYVSAHAERDGRGRRRQLPPRSPRGHKATCGRIWATDVTWQSRISHYT